MSSLLLRAGSLALGLAFSVTLTTGASAAPKTTIAIGLALEPPVLDPTINPADPIRIITNGNIFEGLAAIEEDGRVVPRLATGWSTAPDGLHWTFTLRPGVRFSDGTGFDCGIVQFSLGRATAPDSINPQKQRLAAIAGVSCPSPHIAVIALKRPIGNLPYDLAWPDAAMVAPADAASDGVHPVGTGPYVFASWTRGDSVTLRRNDHYWGAAPKIATVTYRFISDPLAATNALIGGQIDAYPSFLSADMLARFAHSTEFTVARGPSPAKLLLALNDARKPFDDVRVRRALAFAIDRAALRDTEGGDDYTVIGSHMAASDPDHVDLSRRYAYDPEAAKKLLAEAGLAGGFSTTIALPPIDYARKAGELIQAYLEQVGVHATLHPVSWPEWLANVYSKHDFDTTVIAHVEPDDLDIYARPDYYFGYHSAVYDALFARYEAASDPAERHRLSAALQEKLADDEPNVFLLSGANVGVWNAKLHGLWKGRPIPAFPLAGAWWTP